MRDVQKERMNDNILSFFAGKYEVIRSLGSGSFSTVYLVRHMVLELEQAIKVIPKTNTDQLSVLSEARLLKSIHHPGIPMIYDIEEDEECYYLIEEYVCGESLSSFLLNQSIISQNLFFSICRQVCDIFIYLHTFMPFPILYQDLKPEHIIVCGDQIKLIDFGVSSYVANSGNNVNHFGNLQFSAPEHLQGADLSTSADVFSLGKLMQFLSPYVEPALSRKVSNIIQKSIHSDPLLRYETVEELLSDLEKEFSKTRSSHLVNHIAVIGSRPGSGATFLSIALVSTLNLLSQNCIYLEKNNSDCMRNLFAVTPSMYERENCFFLHCFKGFPKYGPGIALNFPEHAIYVSDYGCIHSDISIEQADLILFVCDDAPWNIKDATDSADFIRAHKDQLKIIVNPGNKQASSFLAKTFGVPVYPFFVDENAFFVTRKKIGFFRKLLDQKGRPSLCFSFKNLLLPLLRP